MRSIDLYSAFHAIDDDVLERSETAAYRQKGHSSIMTHRFVAALVAAIIALALCGFAAYELGLFDPWLQKPSIDPVKTVQSAIEGQAGKEYTVTARVDEIKIDEDETARVRARYAGSELAEAWGWTEQYLTDHFVVVWAKYYVEYDHTKTFLDDGCTEQYFYLTQDTTTGEWSITDNDSPRIDTETSQEQLPDKGNEPTEYPNTVIVPAFDLDEPSEPATP